MKRSIIFLPAIVLLLFFSACEDRLDVSVGDDNPRLVVEGRITNGGEPVEVRLSWTTGYDHGYRPPKLSGATVCISDSEGNCTDLHEVDNGLYSSVGTGLEGREGVSYYIEIGLPDGRRYVSTPEELQSAPGIDTSYADFTYRERINRFNFVERVPSMELYADVINPLSENNYLLWEWEGVYMFDPPLAPLPQTCYITEPGIYSRLNLMSDENFSSELVRAQKVDFVDVDFRFKTRYSVELQQYALSVEAFDYLRGLKHQLDRSGSITDPPPYRVRGNIINSADENEVVLGYFYVAGKAVSHLFIERSQVLLDSVGEMSCDGPPFAAPPPICVNCLSSPYGSIEPPSYWRR